MVREMVLPSFNPRPLWIGLLTCDLTSCLLVFYALGVGRGVVFACPRLWPVWFVMWGLLGSVWHGCSHIGVCLVVLGSCSRVEGVGVGCLCGLCPGCGRLVLFGVMLVWVVGSGFVCDVLSGGFVPGCFPHLMFLGEVLPVFRFF